MENYIETEHLVQKLNKHLYNIGALFTKKVFPFEGTEYPIAITISNIERIEHDFVTLSTYRATVNFHIADFEDVLHLIYTGDVTFSLPLYMTNDSDGVASIMRIILSSNSIKSLYEPFRLSAGTYLNKTNEEAYILEGIDKVLEDYSIDRGRNEGLRDD